MNKTLIIYDNDGAIISQITGFYKIPNGLPYLEVIIPSGKYVKSVNAGTKEVVYEDIPKSDIQILGDKISILQEENEKLKESQMQQDTDILVTQEAVDFLMLSNIPMVMNLNNIKLGGNTMAAYIATRIMKKGKISVEAGRDYYVTFLTHQSYSQYKSEVDLILKAEGKEELIVDLTNM